MGYVKKRQHMAKDSKDSENTVSSRMETSDFQHAHAQKKDARYLKDRRASDEPASSRLQISDSQPETLTVPPGIPAEVWLGVARAKHLLQLQNLDLAVDQKRKERKINFVKDVLEVFSSIIPDIAGAIGGRRSFTKSEAINSISAIASILKSYIRTL